jgi:hypothetical protein
MDRAWLWVSSYDTITPGQFSATCPLGLLQNLDMLHNTTRYDIEMFYRKGKVTPKLN